MAQPTLYKYDIVFTPEFQAEIAEAWLEGDNMPNLEVSYTTPKGVSTASLSFVNDGDFPIWGDDSDTNHIYCDAEGKNAIFVTSVDANSLEVIIESIKVQYSDDFATAVKAVVSQF